MRCDASVIADRANGAAMVAGRQVEMSPAAAGGAFRFGGANGPVLRPLAFAERTEIVTTAAAMARPREAVAASVLAASILEDGSGDGLLLEVLAMWLAGAAWDAPSFPETTLLVARGGGWSPADLLGAPAAEIDRLAVHLDEQQRGDGWDAIVFEPPPAEDVVTVHARYADQLLRRSAITCDSTATVATWGGLEPRARSSRPRTVEVTDAGVMEGCAPSTLPPMREQEAREREADEVAAANAQDAMPAFSERTDGAPALHSGGFAAASGLECGDRSHRFSSGGAADLAMNTGAPRRVKAVTAVTALQTVGASALLSLRVAQRLTPAVSTAAGGVEARPAAPAGSRSELPFAAPAGVLTTATTTHHERRLLLERERLEIPMRRTEHAEHPERSGLAAGFPSSAIAVALQSGSMAAAVRELAALLDDEADLRGIDR